MSMIGELEGMRDSALAEIEAASDLEKLDAVRVAYLGKKGSLTQILRGLGSLSPEEKPVVGKSSNEVRQALEAALDRRKAVLQNAALDAKVAVGEAGDDRRGHDYRAERGQKLSESHGQIASFCKVFFGNF